MHLLPEIGLLLPGSFRFVSRAFPRLQPTALHAPLAILAAQSQPPVSEGKLRVSAKNVCVHSKHALLKPVATQTSLAQKQSLLPLTWPAAMHCSSAHLKSALRRRQEDPIGVVHQIQVQPTAWLPIPCLVKHLEPSDAALKHAAATLLVHILLTVAGQGGDNPDLQAHTNGLTCSISFRSWVALLACRLNAASRTGYTVTGQQGHNPDLQIDQQKPLLT